MDYQVIRDEFDYPNTAQEFANYLWRRARRQYKKFTDREIPFVETYPHADVLRDRDGIPYLVKYTSAPRNSLSKKHISLVRNTTFTDPADGQERVYSEYIPGITFDLDPLPNGHTHVIAQCHHKAFEEWYHHLLGLFGVQIEVAPLTSTDVLMPQSGRQATDSRPTAYSDSTARTTLVHYLVTKQGHTQKLACGLVGVSDTTYRDHRDNNKLLSEEEYQRQCGETINAAAKRHIR